MVQLQSGIGKKIFPILHIVELIFTKTEMALFVVTRHKGAI